MQSVTCNPNGDIEKKNIWNTRTLKKSWGRDSLVAILMGCLASGFIFLARAGTTHWSILADFLPKHHCSKSFCQRLFSIHRTTLGHNAAPGSSINSLRTHQATV